MSVLVEAINVIIRRETIERKYPGGVDAYQRNCPNRTFCADEHLTRVGFMGPADTRKFIGLLIALGFVLLDGEKFVDIAIIDERVGLTKKCDWLVAGKFSDGWAGCWLAGTDDAWTAFPEGRTPESVTAANLTLVSTAAEANYGFVKHEGNLAVLKHKDSGELKYAARDEGGGDESAWR